MVNLEAYRKFKFESSYIKKNKIIPAWLLPEHKFISPFEGFGAINILPNNAITLLETLGVDAILSVEGNFAFTIRNVPFMDAVWVATWEIESTLLGANGEVIWEYDFTTESSLTEKDKNSFNALILSSSSITGKQSYELVKPAVELSSKKIIDSLYADILFTKKVQ